MTETQAIDDYFAALVAANARRSEAIRVAQAEFDREAGVARRTCQARLGEIREARRKEEAEHGTGAGGVQYDDAAGRYGAGGYGPQPVGPVG